MKPYVVMGIALGATCGIVFYLIISVLCNKDRKLKVKYDERQQLVRGKCFEYGFFSMIICLVALMIIKAGDIYVPVHDAVLVFFVVMVGVIVNVTYAIMHDAYFGLNTRFNSYLVVLAVAMVINVVSTIIYAVSEGLVIDGVLGCGGVVILSGVFFLWVFIVLIIKKFSDAKEE